MLARDCGLSLSNRVASLNKKPTRKKIFFRVLDPEQELLPVVKFLCLLTSVLTTSAGQQEHIDSYLSDLQETPRINDKIQEMKPT